MSKLGDLIHKGRQERQKNELEELLTGGPKHGTAIESLTAPAREERERRAFDEAREELVADPTLVDSADSRSRFLADHVGTTYYMRLRHEVDNLHAQRRPKPAPDDTPADQNTAFVVRTRPF